jgi:hypothetical protein
LGIGALGIGALEHWSIGALGALGHWVIGAHGLSCKASCPLLLQAAAASVVLLWPHLLLLLVPRAASLVVVVEACQLLALLGLLQIDWPSGAAGMYVAEGLAALQVFLQAPRLSLLSCAGESEAEVWRWLQLLPLLQAGLLLLSCATSYLGLRTVCCVPRAEVRARVATRTMRAAAYWAALQQRQWAGLLLRAAQRAHCELRPLRLPVDEEGDEISTGSAASGSGAKGRVVGAEWRTCWHGGYELEPPQLQLALASLPLLLLLPLCAAFGLRWLARHRRLGS